MTSDTPIHVRIGHSPDPDDAFMFWAIAEGGLATDGYSFSFEQRDIETLNHWALDGRLEVTAISLHAYPYVQDRYALLPHGASMGDGYGPLIVTRAGVDATTLSPSSTIAIPGTMTTAWLAANLWAIERWDERFTNFAVVAFDEIPAYVGVGKADAGLLIHEGQLTFERDGLAQVEDLGIWFGSLTGGLPLPLGCNTIRRDLDAGVQRDLNEILARSIDAALENRDQALSYALRFGRGIDTSLADRFVDMYVNDITRDYGDRGRAAVVELLDRAAAAGLFRMPLVDLPAVEAISPAWLEPVRS